MNPGCPAHSPLSHVWVGVTIFHSIKTHHFIAHVCERCVQILRTKSRSIRNSFAISLFWCLTANLRDSGTTLHFLRCFSLPPRCNFENWGSFQRRMHKLVEGSCNHRAKQKLNIEKRKKVAPNMTGSCQIPEKKNWGNDTTTKQGSDCRATG